MAVDKKKAALQGGIDVRKKAKPKKGMAAKKTVRKTTPKKTASKKKTTKVKPAVKAKAKPRKRAKSKIKRKATPGSFKPKNVLWKRRAYSGRQAVYGDPETLWNAAVSYFDWSVKNPIKERKIFCSIGDITKGELLRTQPFTKQALCSHIGICTNTWDTYKKSELLKDVCQQITDIMFHQKFSGAAVGIFTHGIVARELGLVDKHEDVTVPTNKPGTLADFYASLAPPADDGAQAS